MKHTLALLMGLLLLAASANAATMLVDQSNTGSTSFSGSIQPLGPMGQEFTPTFSSLDVVELDTGDSDPGGSSGVTLTLNIRSGTISGTVLGTSVVSLPDGWAHSQPTVFSFTTPVSLTPGNLYMMEVQASGDNWSLAAIDGDPYSGGRSYIGGFGGIHAARDFWFREGLSIIPEPSRALLSLVGIAAIGLRRRRS